MSKIVRQVKKIATQKQVKEATGHLINVAKRHETMLHAMDAYIEQLERLLIAKNILTAAEVESAAEAAINKTQVAALPQQPAPSVVLTDALGEPKDKPEESCTTQCAGKVCNEEACDPPSSIEL